MSKSSTLKYLAYFLLISSVMPMWQYHVGVRMMASELFGVLFICIFFTIGVLKHQLIFKFPLIITQFLSFLIILYFIQILSSVGLIYYGYSYPEFISGAVNQLFLGAVRSLFILVLFITFSAYLCQLSEQKRHKLIMVFIYSIVASCIYQMITLYMLIFNGIDLDSIIWPAISYGMATDIATIDTGIIGTGLGTFYRAGGFTINPNTLAAQIICVIPFFIFLYIDTSKKIYMLFSILCLASLLITISRSGLLAFGIAALTALLFNFKDLIRKFKMPFVFLSLLIAIIFIYLGGEIYNTIALRIAGGMGERSFYLAYGLEIWSESLFFGTGFNTSSISMMRFTDIPNLHNFWIITAAELGLVGLFFTILYFSFIIFKSFQANDTYSKALKCSLLGLLVMGFFNNNLAGFSIQLFVLLLFCAAHSVPQKYKQGQNFNAS